MIALFYLYLFICLTDWLVTLLGGGAPSAPGVVVPVLLLPQLHFLIQIFLQHIIDESTFTETIPSVLYFFTFVNSDDEFWRSGVILFWSVSQP